MKATTPWRFRDIVLMSALFVFAAATKAEETNQWSFDTSLYVLAAGMSGEVTARGVPADLDLDFSDVMANLEFGAMGSMRVGYDRWALTADVIYMGLSAEKNGVSADLDQWMVEPTLSYRFCRGFEMLAGARYNNISGELRGPFGRSPTGTQDWWDPIVGTKISLPLGGEFNFNVRGDVGGFGVGSDFTWQAFPYFSWQFARWGSLQAGYRWVSNDYETGSGLGRFKYDVLSQGPQLGLMFRF